MENRPAKTKTPQQLQAEANERAIGDVFAQLFHISFLFYLICGMIGVASFMLHRDMILYIVTAVVIFSFLAQYGLHLWSSGLGPVWLLIGGIAGYWLFRTLRGLCLGIMVAVILRHGAKRLLLRLFSLLIHWGQNG